MPLDEHDGTNGMESSNVFDPSPPALAALFLIKFDLKVGFVALVF
jgi:hypothetical protein